MHFYKELKKRGLIQEVSDETKVKELVSGTFYCGFDPTAPSLQIGNLVPMIVMAHIARAGLEPIALFGGATGAIGDPSGKASERQLLSRDAINQNIESQQHQFQKIFDRLGLKVKFVNNFEWIQKISTIDFLREYGKYFTVNYMMAKDSVNSRLGDAGISFTEFSYMILQAIDFLELYETENCKLQIGGSDQWGNITAGLELIRKKIQGEAYALTIPLITDNQGKKLGKTEQGTLWLDPNQTSPYRFHQYWLNSDDKDVVRFLNFLTFLDEETISALKDSTEIAPEKREAQKRLADELCTLVHGEAATALARRSADVLFGGSLEGLSDSVLLDIFKEVPSIEVSIDTLKSSSIVDLFAESGLAKSKGEAKRLLQSGGAYVNNVRVTDESFKLGDSNLLDKQVVVLRSGKKKYCLLKQRGD